MGVVRVLCNFQRLESSKMIALAMCGKSFSRQCANNVPARIAELRLIRRLNEQLGLRHAEPILAKNERQGVVLKDSGLKNT